MFTHRFGEDEEDGLHYEPFRGYRFEEEEQEEEEPTSNPFEDLERFDSTYNSKFLYLGYRNN
jgi:hypothetical protein